MEFAQAEVIQHVVDLAHRHQAPSLPLLYVESIFPVLRNDVTEVLVTLYCFQGVPLPLLVDQLVLFLPMPLNTIKDFPTFVCGAAYRQVYSTL